MLTSCTACIDRMAGLTALGTAIDFAAMYRVDGYGILQLQFFHHEYTCTSQLNNTTLTHVPSHYSFDYKNITKQNFTLPQNLANTAQHYIPYCNKLHSCGSLLLVLTQSHTHTQAHTFINVNRHRTT